MSEATPYSPPILRLLERVARSVGDPTQGSHPLRRWIRICQWLLWAATVAYTVGLVFWLGWLEFFGDMWWGSWFFLYLPPALFLFPLFCQVPLALLLDWRALFPPLLCVLLVFGFYDDLEWHWSRSPQTPGNELRVLTNNIGQHGNYPLTPFLDQQNPDVILLQEAFRRGDAYVQQYQERNLQTEYRGEFICASRFPIVESELIKDVLCSGEPVAARFVLDVRGRRVVVYNVHIASPRSLLGKLRGRGAIAQFLHDCGFAIGRNYEAAEKVADRLAAAKRLADRIAQETHPVIVAGDFNIPARGRAYHYLARHLTDAFEVRGRGYGFTFPGRTRNPFSLFGPWLRLDLVFASKDWRVLDSQVEPRRPSQHRAVVATLELKEP